MARSEQDNAPREVGFASSPPRSSRGSVAAPSPVARHLESGGPSLRLDAGHSRFRLDRAGRHWWNRSALVATDEGARSDAAIAWTTAPSPGCLIAACDRQARAGAALVNWVTRDHSGRDVAQLDPGVVSAPAVRLAPRSDALEGLLLAPAADPGTSVPDGWEPRRRASYATHVGAALGADWWAGDVRERAGRYRFRAFHREVFCAEVRLAAPGDHLIVPALGALAVGIESGMTAAAARDELESCGGVRRRFDVRGTFRGVTLVDDDAEGDRGVALALELARLAFGDRPIRVVYHGPQISAGSALNTPGANEFARADHLILVDSSPLRSESTRLLVAGLRSSGASVVHCASCDGAVRELDRTLEPGDVLVTLGADEVGTIADAFLRRLPRDRHGC